MEKHVIQEKLKNSPGIIYNVTKNKLEITGRSIPENPEVIFRKLDDWLSEYIEKNNDLDLQIQLEYINSASSKYLNETLKNIAVARNNGKNIHIKWFYDEEDEAMKELGEHYRDNAGIPIEMVMVI